MQRRMLEESHKMVDDTAGRLGNAVQDLRELVVRQFGFVLVPMLSCSVGRALTRDSCVDVGGEESRA